MSLVFGFVNLLGFIISLVISAVVVFVTAKLFKQKEGFGTAILTAFIGAVIYAAMGVLIPGIIGSLFALVGWLVALGYFYRIGWLMAGLMALIIWFFATIIGVFLPILPSPF